MQHRVASSLIEHGSVARGMSRLWIQVHCICSRLASAKGLARMPVLKQLVIPLLQCNLLPSDIWHHCHERHPPGNATGILELPVEKNSSFSKIIVTLSSLLGLRKKVLV